MALDALNKTNGIPTRTAAVMRGGRKRRRSPQQNGGREKKRKKSPEEPSFAPFRLIRTAAMCPLFTIDLDVADPKERWREVYLAFQGQFQVAIRSRLKSNIRNTSGGKGDRI